MIFSRRRKLCLALDMRTITLGLYWQQACATLIHLVPSYASRYFSTAMESPSRYVDVFSAKANSSLHLGPKLTQRLLKMIWSNGKY